MLGEKLRDAFGKFLQHVIIVLNLSFDCKMLLDNVL